ncbi:MAG: hypothetical protein WCX22_00760 [Methanoregula sp.]
MAAGIVVILLIILAAGYPFIKNSLSAGKGTSSTSSTDVPNESYVVVMDEEPLVTVTTDLPVATTILPTTSLPRTTTVPEETKPLICASDRLMCNSTCVDAKTSSSHCGVCNNACANGQSCVNGNCQKACSFGQTACVEGCFDLLTDADHCGTCGNNCPAGLLCSEGRCTAPETPMIIAV